MRLLIVLFLAFYCGALFSAECDAPDVSNYEFYEGNFNLGQSDTYSVPSGKDGLYVSGNVVLNQSSKLTGYLYATGSIELKNSATVTEDVFSESTITLKNNADIGGVSCENVENSFSIDLPVGELEGQCNDIFTDAVQSYSGGKLTAWNPAFIDDDTTEFDFGSHATGSNTCGSGVACSSTGEQSTQLSSFSIPNIDGQDIDAYSWNSVSHLTLGVDTDDTDNGEYSGTVFGDLEINSNVSGGASISFVEQTDPLTDYYYINSIHFANANAVLNLSPGVYALNTFTAPAGGTINIVGDGEVYLFIEDTPNQMSLTVEAEPTKFHFISNDSNNTQLSSNTNIDGSIYFSGDLTISGATINGRVASQNLTMNSSASITNSAVCGTDPSDNYTFTFDGTQTQALTCEPHSVDIQARINGAIDTGYNNSVTISTSSGLGDWTIGSANGTLDNGTAGDGNATYQFVGNDNGEIELYLSHGSDGDVSVTISNADATEAQALTFSSAVLKTELSCVDDSLGACMNTANLPFTMTMTAVKEDDQTNECVNYNPTEINFWSEYVTPIAPTGLAVEVEGNQVGTAESVATPLAISFIDGVASVSVNYPDAGLIIIHAQDASNSDIEGEAETIVNPLQLLVDNINATNGNSNPVTTNSGNGFSRASVADYSNLVVETFDMTVTGLKDCSNDTQGHCTGTYGERAPSFASEIDLQTSLVFPSSGTLGNLQYDGDDGYKVDLVSGLFTYEDLAYDEVGSFGVTASTVDGYLITGNQIETTMVQTVGRFYPDYLAVNSFSVEPACVAGDFTYLGQIAIDVSYNMQAYAQGGQNITTNYDQSLGYPVAGENGSTVFYDQAYDQAPLSLTARLLPDDYYLPSSWIAGQYNVIGQNMGIAKDTSPDGPYLSDNRIDYFIKLTGIDGEKIQTDSATTCTDDSCNIGDLGDLAYGRLQAGNSHGSEYAAIRTDITSTYFDGTRFINFSRDDCSTVVMSQVSSEPTKNASNQITVTDSVAGTSGTTTLSIINSPLIDGHSQFDFSAPGSRGQLDYYINIDTVAPWLLDSGNAVDCPEGAEDSGECISGSVSFGLFRGNDRIIYRLQTFD